MRQLPRPSQCLSQLRLALRMSSLPSVRLALTDNSPAALTDTGFAARPAAVEPSSPDARFEQEHARAGEWLLQRGRATPRPNCDFEVVGARGS